MVTEKDEMMEDVVVNLRSVIQSCKGGVLLNNLQRDYKRLVGGTIPFQTLGFSSLEVFLQDIPHVVKLRKCASGEVFAEAVSDASTAHLSSLISKQKGKSFGSKKRSQRSALFRIRNNFNKAQINQNCAGSCSSSSVASEDLDEKEQEINYLKSKLEEEQKINKKNLSDVTSLNSISQTAKEALKYEQEKVKRLEDQLESLKTSFEKDKNAITDQTSLLNQDLENLKCKLEENVRISQMYSSQVQHLNSLVASGKKSLEKEQKEVQKLKDQLKSVEAPSEKDKKDDKQTSLLLKEIADLKSKLEKEMRISKVLSFRADHLDSLLKRGQESLKTEQETVWKLKSELNKLQADSSVEKLSDASRSSLLKEIEHLKSELEIEEQIRKKLKSELETKTTTNKYLMSKTYIKKSQTLYSELQTEKDINKKLQSELEREKETNKTLSSQLNHLNCMMQTGPRKVAVDQKMIEELKDQLGVLKEEMPSYPVSVKNSQIQEVADPHNTVFNLLETDSAKQLNYTNPPSTVDSQFCNSDIFSMYQQQHMQILELNNQLQNQSMEIKALQRKEQSNTSKLPSKIKKEFNEMDVGVIVQKLVKHPLFLREIRASQTLTETTALCHSDPNKATNGDQLNADKENGKTEHPLEVFPQTSNASEKIVEVKTTKKERKRKRMMQMVENLLAGESVNSNTVPQNSTQTADSTPKYVCPGKAAMTTSK